MTEVLNKIKIILEDMEQEFSVDLLKNTAFLCALENEGITLHEVIERKDNLMTKSVRVNDGSFYTPNFYAWVAYKKLQNVVKDISDYIVWEVACGTGNLLDPFFYEDVDGVARCSVKKVYASTLHEEDVELVKVRYRKYVESGLLEVFQLDYLSAVDTGGIFKEFLYKLPTSLQNELLSGSKLIFHSNPPYSTLGANVSAVHQYLSNMKLDAYKSDLLKQFIWQTYHIIESYGLQDVYVSYFGTTSLYLFDGWRKTLQLMTDNSYLVDGFFISSNEFLGLSKDLEWFIYYTIYKVGQGEGLTKLPLLSTDEEGNLQIELLADVTDWSRKSLRSVLYERRQLGEVVTRPMIDFKGNILRDKQGSVLMLGQGEDVLFQYCSKISFRQIGRIMSICNQGYPADKGFSVTLDNFDNVVAHFLFESVVDTTNKAYMFTPHFDVLNRESKEYQIWLANALVLLPFLPKSYVAGYTVELEGRIYHYNNPVFPLSLSEVQGLTGCNSLCNDNKAYMSRLAHLSEDLLFNSVKELRDFGISKIKGFLERLDENSVIIQKDNLNVLECAFCGFTALKSSGFLSEDEMSEYKRLFENVVKELNGLPINRYYKLLEG